LANARSTECFSPLLLPLSHSSEAIFDTEHGFLLEWERGAGVRARVLYKPSSGKQTANYVEYWNN
jgi:hypothetical protein